LKKAGVDRVGTDENTFFSVLVYNSPAQLRAIFNAYKTITGRDIEIDASSELSGTTKNCILSLSKVFSPSWGFDVYITRKYKNKNTTKKSKVKKSAPCC